MDLLQTVRKEGSRGGVNFSWSDVKDSQHRENYLGHSLMAPVGRWQKNKDLSWYAKAEDAELTPEQRAEKEREAKKEELRKVKEAEEDAMARALGLPVPDRNNANLQPLGMSKEASKALKDALGGDEEADGRGVGYGKSGATKGGSERETLRGSKSQRDNVMRSERRRDYDEGEDRHAKRRRKSRSRDRDRDDDRDRDRRPRNHRRREHSRSRSRSRSRDRHRRRSRSRDQRRHSEHDQRQDTRDGERSRSRDRYRTRRRNESRSRSRSPFRDRRKGRRDS